MAELQNQAERPRRPIIHAERGRTRMFETHPSSIMHLQDDDDLDDLDDDLDDDELGDEDDDDSDEDDEEEGGWQVTASRRSTPI
jgi:hypothetical protein